MASQKPLKVTGQALANVLNQLTPSRRQGTKAVGYTGTGLMHVRAPSVAAAQVAVGRAITALDNTLKSDGRSADWMATTMRVKVKGHPNPVNIDITGDMPRSSAPTASGVDAARASDS